jgi:hypothetical protein
MPPGLLCLPAVAGAQPKGANKDFAHFLQDLLDVEGPESTPPALRMV